MWIVHIASFRRYHCITLLCYIQMNQKSPFKKEKRKITVTAKLLLNFSDDI